MFYTILYKVHTDYVQYRSVFQAQAFRNDCVVWQEELKLLPLSDIR